MPSDTTASTIPVHGNGRSHGHGEVDYASENREHYNRTAGEFEAVPGALELGASIGQGIRDHYAFDPEKTRVLEFASGTGLVSRELTAHTKSILGVDISQGVVDFYNKRFASQGLPSEKVHAIVAELDPDSPETIPVELKDQKFDLVFCSMAYHHFPDIDAKTRLLASFLAPGGTLLVVDIVKTDLTVAEAQRTFAKLAAEADGKPAPGVHSHTHQHSHSHSHSHQHPPTFGDRDSPADHSHVKYGVAHVGGIAEDDIKAAFAGATTLGLDMSTYEYLPFTTAKIWEAELSIFLVKVTKKPE